MRMSTSIKKLQSAINRRAGAKILINTRQWYSFDTHRPVSIYTVHQTIGDKEDKKTVELYKTYSQVRLVLWLRDYWFELNGWEVPHDNEIWEGLKKEYDTSNNRREGEQNANG